MPRKTKQVKVYYPKSLPSFTEERDFKIAHYDHLLESPMPFKTLTLKGRLEMRKDYKAVLYAASQTPGIVSLNFDQYEVAITWLSSGISSEGEFVECFDDAKKHICTFIQKIKEAPDQDCFSDLGLETHVFWQSLKPITSFDGERDGFWA
jgi:hypothetical protein